MTTQNITKISELVRLTERQREFWDVIGRKKYVLYGGAKSGGKSYALRWLLLKKLLWWGKQGIKGVRVGLFCENYPALKDRQITKIKSEFPDWLGTLSDNQIEGMSFVLKEKFGGGILALRNLDDVSKYASSEFAWAAVDELTKNRREVFDQLRSIIRWPGIEDTRFIAGTNPGDIGHAWVKRLWIDRSFDPKYDPPGDDVAFVRSLPSDNPYNAQSYLDELKKLPEKLRKAYWEGDWDIFSGQYFEKWRRDIHVLPRDYKIEGWWNKFCGYDHGYNHPYAFGAYAVDGDGNVIKYGEAGGRLRGVGEIYEDMRVVCPEVNALTVSAGHDCWSKQRDGGPSVAEQFERCGLRLVRANIDRIQGAQQLREYLDWKEDNGIVVKKPKFYVTENCWRTIQQIPAMVYDEHRHEDVQKVDATESDPMCGDDYYDETRYALMSRPMESKPELRIPPMYSGQWWEERINENSDRKLRTMR